MANQSRHILVADDNREHREALARIFSRQGYQVTSVADGVEALRIAAAATIDLVVTDLRMPRLDGVALLRAPRTNHLDLPVIIITAYGDDVSGAEAAGWGAVAFLQKPIRKDDILAIVARAIGPGPRPNAVGANRGTGL